MILYTSITLGWSPILAVVTDGSRRVYQVVGWAGGTGEAPATSVYIGATGFVSDIADAVDVRGSTGATGAGVAAGGSANQALTKVDGTNYNTQWTTIDKTFVSLGNVPDVDATNANNISSGTLPDGRFPATLPALNGSALTNLNASNLASGTVPDGRLQYIISILAASFAATNNVTNGATQYISPVSGFANFNASEAIRIWTVPPGLTGKIRDFIITTNGTQPSTGSLVITFRKNTSNESVTVTVAANAAQGDFQDITNSFSITGGDKISIQGVNNASTASTSVIAISAKVTNY